MTPLSLLSKLTPKLLQFIYTLSFVNLPLKLLEDQWIENYPWPRSLPSTTSLSLSSPQITLLVFCKEELILDKKVVR